MATQRLSRFMQATVRGRVAVVLAAVFILCLGVGVGQSVYGVLANHAQIHACCSASSGCHADSAQSGNDTGICTTEKCGLEKKHFFHDTDTTYSQVCPVFFVLHPRRVCRAAVTAVVGISDRVHAPPLYLSLYAINGPPRQA